MWTGNIVCGTMSNLFLRRGSTLMTPVLDRCGVAGRDAPLGSGAGGGDLRLRVWQGAVALARICAMPRRCS